MLKTIKAAARRVLKVSGAQRFTRNRDAIAAVEFAFIAAPFFGLLFAILETALVFFAWQTLEAAVADTSRLIMTGQAQQAGYDAEKFKKALCLQLVTMFDCQGGVYVSVQTGSDFDAPPAPPKDKDGKLDTTSLPFSMGTAGSIVVVQAYYQWPIYVPLLDKLANLGADHRLLVATAAFRNEPYN